MTLYEELNAPLPEYFPNFQGKLVAIPFPKKGTLIARCGNVFWFQIAKDRHAIIYGLEANSNLLRGIASMAFGHACFHQAQCESLVY